MRTDFYILYSIPLKGLGFKKKNLLLFYTILYQGCIIWSKLLNSNMIYYYNKNKFYFNS